jgi:thiol-disulfide isomerase/thioredoxin
MRSLKAWVLLALVSVCAARTIAQGASLVGNEAPRFIRSDLHGRQIDVEDFRGKVVLLNFWATWCGPCRVELPTFARWQKQYGAEGLQVLAVSMDDDSKPVGKAVRKLHLNYPVVMGDERLGLEYGGVLGLPITYLIGRDGKIAARFGGETDLNAMEKQVRTLLEQR